VITKRLAGKFYTPATKEELAEKASKAKNLQLLVDTKEILDGILDTRDVQEDAYQRAAELRDLLLIKKHISQINSLQDTWKN
jgi:hypothetical protein